MNHFARAGAWAQRFIRLTTFGLLGLSGSVSAYLATCPGGQEPVFYVESVGDVGWYAGGWRDCVLQRVGTVALGKLTQGEIEGAIRACDGTYTSTWEHPLEWGSWNGQRHVKFCSCAEHGYPGLRCRAKQWRSDGSEPSCPNAADWYMYPISVASGCRTCARKLTLLGGGQVETRKALEGQKALVTYCSAQPEQNVLVQLSTSPLDPPLGPAGQLRPAGTNSAGASTYLGITNASGEVSVDFVAPSASGTHTLTARCTDPGKTCTPDPTPAKTITVIPCGLSLNLSGGGQVEPIKTLAGFTAGINDCHGQPQKDVSLEIVDSVEQHSGSHYHGSDTAQARLGQFFADPSDSCGAGTAPGRMVCTSDADGQINFDYRAPGVAGVHTLTASCSTPDCPSPVSSSEIEVLVEGLVAIESPPASLAQYHYIGEPPPGQGDTHPYRHYLKPAALSRLNAISDAYSQVIGEPLCVNDASLPWGGIFDLGNDWLTPHTAHSCGNGVDIAGKSGANYPYDCEVGGQVNGARKMRTFQQIYLQQGVFEDPSHSNHYHLYLRTPGKLPCS